MLVVINTQFIDCMMLQFPETEFVVQVLFSMLFSKIISNTSNIENCCISLLNTQYKQILNDNFTRTSYLIKTHSKQCLQHQFQQNINMLQFQQQILLKLTYYQFSIQKFKTVIIKNQIWNFGNMLGFLKNFSQSNTDATVTMKVKVWNRDSYELFDYASEAIEKNKYLLSEETFLAVDKKNGGLFMSNKHSENSITEKSKKYIMGSIKPYSFQNGSSSFVFKPAQQSDKQNIEYTKMLNGTIKIITSYLVFHQDKNKGFSHKLNVNDVIKLGITIFKVTKIQSPSSKITTSILTENGQEQIYNCMETVKGACKICLMEEDPQYEMISPCDCKGSCSCVHVSCLKQWIASRGNVKKGKTVQTLDYNKLNCQICKKSYPDKVIIKGKQTNLYHLQNPKQTFMVLQTASTSKTQEGKKSVFVISPNQSQSVYIGRAQSCNVRIQDDKSMSKVHSVITMKNGEFYLTDNGSKFGTLVKINKPINVKKHNFIQAGRFLFEFKYFTN